MKKLLTITLCALAAQLTANAQQQPDLHRVARDIQHQTGGTYQDARDASRDWAKRNGYEY